MPSFINADLEITALQDLSCIRDEFGDAVSELCCSAQDDGSFLASFEIGADLGESDPEKFIVAFCDLLRTLSPRSRRVWDAATRRVIDLGYQSDQGHRVLRSHLSTVTLESLREHRIELVITVYPLEGKLKT
jgi:hypothetical protein